MLGTGETASTLDSVLHSVRPIFAAAIAIVIGEMTSWGIHRLRGDARA
jgi:hypothetical protein